MRFRRGSSEKTVLSQRFWITSDDDSMEIDFSGELGFRLRSCSVGFKFDDDERDFTAHIRVPFVGYTFLSLKHPLLKLVSELVRDAIPNDIFGKGTEGYGSRDFSVRVSDWALYWRFGADPMGWSRSRPRWRDGAWYPLGHNQQQTVEVIADHIPMGIPMPEDLYMAEGKLERVTYGFQNLPRMFDKTILRMNVRMLEDEQIPIPGKGENSWDCDEDAMYASSFPVPYEEGCEEVVHYSVGQVIDDIYKTRARRGGKNWKPEHTKEERKIRRLEREEERRRNPPPEPMVAAKVQA